MRHSIISFILLLSAICSFIVNGVALSEEVQVKEATEVQAEMLHDKTDVQDENKPSDSETVANNQGEYTVKQGDTLSGIAESTLGSADKWTLIAKINSISNPDEIFVGQKLTLPSNSYRHEIKVDKNKSEGKLNEKPDYQTDSEIVDSDEGALKVSEASTTEYTTENTITGQIESAQSGSYTLIITDENGDSHQFKLSNSDILDGVKQGDTVEVGFQDGMAVSVVQKDVPVKQEQMNN